MAAARTLWVPAVNNHGGFGRWAVVEVTDPWEAAGVIRRAVAERCRRRVQVSGALKRSAGLGNTFWSLAPS